MTNFLESFLVVKPFGMPLIVACILCVAPVAAMSGSFKQIKAEKEFRDAVADKILTADWGSMVIHSNGKISGKVGKQKMVGAWNWQGKYWCRNVRVGKNKERGTDCQKISISGNQMEFIRNQGKGDGGILTIGK